MNVRLRNVRMCAARPPGRNDTHRAVALAAVPARSLQAPVARRRRAAMRRGLAISGDGGDSMTIRSLSQIDASRSVETDVCIIGAGMAGLFLAQQLCTLGIRVIVVESGRKLSDGDAAELNEICDDDGRYKWPVTGRMRGPGGSSAVWGGKMIPLTPGDLEERAYLPVPQWPLSHAELLEGLRDVEAFFRLDRGSYENDSPQHSRTGYEFPRHDRDFSVRWAKWAGFRRGNVWTILRAHLHRFPNLDLWLDATVCGFTADTFAGRVSTAICRNQSDTKLAISARHFVVAAGTIESTRLLLLLDEMHDGRVFEDCNALGHYFQDHLDAQVGRLVPIDAPAVNKLFGIRYSRLHRRSPHLELTQAAQRTEGVASAFVHVTSDVSQNRTLASIKQIARALETHDYRALPAKIRDSEINPRLLGEFLIWRGWRHTLLVPNDVDLNLRVCIEQSPRSDNRITLAHERDRLGARKVALKWLPGEADERTFRVAMDRFADFWRRNGFERICRIGWVDAARGGTTSILDIAQDYAHPSGTTRMGLSRSEAVVGPDLVCHLVPNLSVVSASCFPSAGSANPTLTIMLLAWRSARAIVRSVQTSLAMVPAAAIQMSGAANV